VCLFYNRRFRRPSHALATWGGSYTAFFDPDYSILATVIEGQSKQRHCLHFDAKHRLEMAEVETLFDAVDDPVGDLENRQEGTAHDREIARLHKQDDLFKMHTYRDRGPAYYRDGSVLTITALNPIDELVKASSVSPPWR
jgi:predicted component of viral defense system (DUF524 family)